VCRADGTGYDARDACEPFAGNVCRAGRCVDLCREATLRRSNVGCEYWAADLDNAAATLSPNAAADRCLDLDFLAQLPLQAFEDERLVVHE
jgi:hypothetical protein